MIPGSPGHPRAQRRLGPLLALAVAITAVGARAEDRAAAPPPATASAAVPGIQQPRAFGHQIGDRLVQRLRLPPGQDLPPALLDRERVGVWFERQSARRWTEASGERWAELVYQVINVPPTPAVVELPAWRLASAPGQAGMEVPAWAVGLAPLSLKLPSGRGPWQAMQDDRRPAPIPTEGLARSVLLAWGGVAAVALAWGAWWARRRARDAASLPFARAWQELKGLDPGAPGAWAALHRAFDRSAGEVLHASTVDAWLARAPQYRRLQADIEGFFAASHARFFQPPDPSAEGADLRGLCDRLQRVERGAAP